MFDKYPSTPKAVRMQAKLMMRNNTALIPADTSAATANFLLFVEANLAS